MARRSRSFLFDGPFANGQRPDENNFRDVWDSFLNFEDDPMSLDGDNNFVFSQGVRIGNTPNETPGTIRFNGTVFQFREAADWQTLGAGGGGGAFQPIDATTNVAYNDGRVGIATGTTPTNYLFEARIGINDGPANQIRFGSAVIHDRSTGSTPDRAHFSHFSRANDTDFALRQRDGGDVNINAPLAETIRFSQNGTEIRMAVLANSGNVVVGASSVGNTVLTGNPTARLFVVNDVVIFTGNNFISMRQLDARITALGG